MLKGHLLTRSTGTSRLIHCFDWSGSTLARGFSKRGSTLTGSKLKEDSETFVVSGAVSVTDILKVCKEVWMQVLYRDYNRPVIRFVEKL